MMKNRKGFTLIELLIVVVIIGILAAIAIPKFSATREKAYISAMKADLRNLQSAQEIYYAGFKEGAGEGEAGGIRYEYATTLAELDFTESEGVTITLDEGTTSATGWSATATHRAFGGATDAPECTVKVGSAAGESDKAGVVICTGEK